MKEFYSVRDGRFKEYFAIRDGKTERKYINAAKEYCLAKKYMELAGYYHFELERLSAENYVDSTDAEIARWSKANQNLMEIKGDMENKGYSEKDFERLEDRANDELESSMEWIALNYDGKERENRLKMLWS